MKVWLLLLFCPPLRPAAAVVVNAENKWKKVKKANIQSPKGWLQKVSMWLIVGGPHERGQELQSGVPQMLENNLGCLKLYSIRKLMLSWQRTRTWPKHNPDIKEESTLQRKRILEKEAIIL